MKRHPATDICIPVHGALPYLKHCIETVLASTENFRVILVDDYSDEETATHLRGLVHKHPDWLLLRTGKQKWFTRAANLALKLTRTEKVLLLNSDCEVNTGWLQEMYDVWDEVQSQKPNAKIGLVGSITRVKELPRWVESLHSNLSYISGHCYLLSMSVLADLATRRGTPGLYFNEKDPDQIHIASDRIMRWDLNDAGYTTIGCHHAAVGHHGGKSWGHNLASIPTRLKDVD